jgi:hypothetical protein
MFTQKPHSDEFPKFGTGVRGVLPDSGNQQAIGVITESSVLANA